CASSQPVVAYETDGLKDIIINGENGFLVKQFDKDALSEKVILLLKDSVLSRKMGEAARKTLNETFDIDFMVKEQEELYLKLLMKRTLRS
ncbi:MAG: glycosyltransferase, partial [Elusimicrobiota bacterium]